MDEHGHVTRDDRRFDAWSRSYDRSWAQTLFFNPVQRSLVAAVSGLASARRVLDIGCGTGRLLDRLATTLPEAVLVGVDRSAGMLGAARRTRPNLHLARGTAEALPYPDATFDLVTSTVSFHHWSDKATALAEVYRVLRPGGLLALADPAPDDLPRWPGLLRAALRRDRHMVPLEERHRLVDEAGLTVRHVARAFHGLWVPLTLAERPNGHV